MLKIAEINQSRCGKFFIVSTPIGNIKDITIRALETLETVDIILCEDTRVSQKLLSHYNIKKELMVYHDFSNEQDRIKILKLLQEGKNLALISDAGTPLLADPGFKLVRYLKSQDISYTHVPGASSITSALVLSSLPSDKFSFIGFLPRSQKQQIEIITSYLELNTSLVFFESAKRLELTLQNILDNIGNVEIAIVREISKIYEEVISGYLQAVCENIKDKIIKGEIVVILDLREFVKNNTEINQVVLKELLSKFTLKDAVEIYVQNQGGNRKDIYKQALMLKNGKL